MNWGKNWEEKKVFISTCNFFYLLRQKRKREMVSVVITSVHTYRTSDAQHNCSPPTNLCAASPWEAVALPPSPQPTSYSFIVFEMMPSDMKDPFGPLISWISCPGSVPYQLRVSPHSPPFGRTVGEAETSLALCNHWWGTNETLMCYQDCFSPKAKT